MRPALLFFLSLFGACVAPVPDNLERAMEPEGRPYRILGTGFITNDGHPERPFQFRRHEVELRLSVYPQLGECVIEIESGDDGERKTDLYYVRRGRIFQTQGDGDEVDAVSFGDLGPATVAALHPVVVANAMQERREMVRVEQKREFLFAWNDELWSGRLQRGMERVTHLERSYYNERLGDGAEEIAYKGWALDSASGLDTPRHVVVISRGREIASVDFTAIDHHVTLSVPEGNRERDRARVVSAQEMDIVEVAPHLYTMDLWSMNTRVTVAEFADYLVVLEGAFSSDICDLMALKLREKFDKPVRYFAFSHLHTQYVGGTRSWVREGATVILPPSTVPLIEAIVEARHDLRPDALARDPQPLQFETVKERLRLEDEVNTLEIYNIESDHTDEYLIFYFPRAKVLCAGDLLFYRPGRPLTGRSKKFCATVEALGLDVERFFVTWPLDQHYGTKNVVGKEEMLRACK